MLHHVAHTLPGRFAFHTWSEARALWDAVLLAAPGTRALVLMPDHLHLLHERDVRGELGAALSGYTRWANDRLGQQGARWHHQPPAVPIHDREKLRRTFRYIYLNPCQGRLTDDPLDWPFSSYRDALGFSLERTFKAHNAPLRLHTFVTAADTVGARARAIPVAGGSLPTPDEVAHAVAGLSRRALADLQVRGAARTAFLTAARTLCDASERSLAEIAGVDVRTVRRQAARWTPEVRLIERALGDPRFEALPAIHLPNTPAWRAYATEARRARHARSWIVEVVA